MPRIRAFQGFLFALLSACSFDEGGKCDVPGNQPLYQYCCSDLGVDACGDGLFCEAFDGHEETTCYAEYSRPEQSECTADVQCISGACNLDVERCLSSPHQPCTSVIGCIYDIDGEHWACDSQGAGTCEVVGNGEPGALCASASDCSCDLCFCRDNACTPPPADAAGLGQLCEDTAECPGGYLCVAYFCSLLCDEISDCREGYEGQGIGACAGEVDLGLDAPADFCLVNCGAESECPQGMSCEVPSEYCYPS